MMIFDPLFAVANAIGLLAFALVGASKAVREEFDLFGVCIIGLVTAFGGGITRDVLLNRIPITFQTYWDVLFGVGGVVLAVVVLAVVSLPDEHRVTVWADAAGLAAFATTGAIVATDIAVSPFGVVGIATVNAVGGSVIADVCLDRQPFILFQDFYASCAVLGGSSFWLASTVAGGSVFPAIACAGITFATRLIAVRRRWRLPAVTELTTVSTGPDPE